jgi:hypothetical protein
MLRALVWMHEVNRACWTRSSITASRVPPFLIPDTMVVLRAALRLLREARIMGLRYLALAPFRRASLYHAGRMHRLSGQRRDFRRILST